MFDISYKWKGKEDLSKYKIGSCVVTGKGKHPVTGVPDLDVKLFLLQANPKISANPENDIACIVNPKVIYQTSVNPTIDFFIDLPLLATRKAFQNDIMICDFLAFPGYPRWHDKVKSRPILRTGTISSDPRFNYQYETEVLGDCLAYEAFSFGGSSGSPVFAVQKGPAPGAGISFPGFRDLTMIGINAGHLRTEEKHHSGISYLYKSYAICDLVG
jgi:hypothetical protein